MTTITPAGLVAAPARTPLPYGLFSVLPFRPNGTDRWEGGGAEWEALSCDNLGGIGAWVCDPGARVDFGGEGLTSWTLTLGSSTTASIDADATAAEVLTAIETATSTSGVYVVTGSPATGFVIITTGDNRLPATISATPTGGTGTVTVGESGPGEATYGLPKTLDANGSEIGSATQFTVYGHFRCSPVGWSPEQAQARALEHLAAREEAAVENALWTGALGNAPSLVDPATTVLPNGGAAQDVVAAVALLEDFIASTYGSLGVIHMTRGTALSALASDALVQSVGRLTTGLGTPVVAGSGYPGTSPEGVVPAAGVSWMYATPALLGYRSEVFTSSDRAGDLLDRGTNDLHAIAERTYLIGFDPCGVAAVQVGSIPT